MDNDRIVKKQGYLKKTTIYPDDTVIGYMNIKRKKGEILTINIPINSYTYSFDWDVTKQQEWVKRKECLFVLLTISPHPLILVLPFQTDKAVCIIPPDLSSEPCCAFGSLLATTDKEKRSIVNRLSTIFSTQTRDRTGMDCSTGV